MITVWTWLAVAGLGALHGLSPANGWMFAAARGVQARSVTQARHALLPIALGHGAAIVLGVVAVAQGVLPNRAAAQGLAGVLLLVVAICRVLRRAARRTECPAPSVGAGGAGLALWSCLMATAHGAGLMLVPALLPLCLSDAPARAITASGSLLLALLAVGVHLAAMLLTAGAIATGVCRGAGLISARPGVNALQHAWTAALAVTGGWMLALR